MLQLLAMNVVLRSPSWLLAAGAVVLLAGCGSPAVTPVARQVGAVQRTAESIQPTYTPLPTYTPFPTSTPYPEQPTYTPLATATGVPTPLPSTSVPIPTTALPRATMTVAAQQSAPSGASELNGVEAMLAAINTVRIGEACAPLTTDDRLRAAADTHAQDLAIRGMITHESGDGSSLEDRLIRTGYPFARRSEVVGRGTGAGVLAAWLAEPPDGPHRGALLNCAYTEAGISVHVAADGRSYWVAIMASERSP